MTFNSSTSDADPGAGKIAFNNGTLSSVSILYVDDADDASADISSFLQSWDDISNASARGIVTVTKEGTPSSYATFKVTGAVTDASGYTKVPVTHIVSAGSFSNTDGVGVHFSYSGADGSGDVSTDGTQTLTNKTLTSPKIGTNILDTNGNELLNLTATSSAVNEFTLANAATGNNPSFTASGGDTNIGVSILPKGSGQVTIDNLTFPAADGSADQVLKTDGSGNLSFTTLASGGTDWQSAVKTSNFTAVAGEGYWINTSSGAVTMTLPSSASVGDEIEFVDYSRSWGTNNCTVALNSLKFQGGTVNPVYDKNGQAVRIVYSGTTNGWIPTSDEVSDLEGITTYDIEYLLVAGGGSGGSRNSGGGGAGGHTTNFTGTKITIQAGSAYTVTVGGGGASPATESIGNDGDDSVLSGAGIATVTAIGGGGGGNGSAKGRDGGSGGGSGSFQNTTFGAGTAGQGNNGGTGMGSGHPYGAGGGGGAGAVGGNASGGPGAGGAGLANSITGSAVTRAGGGGGNSYTSGGAGGSGGGGAGVSSGNGNAGSANAGGGGGGCNESSARGGAGGSGVIILRVPTASYSSTTTGSPTVSTSGSDTIMVFNGSGSYTG